MQIRPATHTDLPAIAAIEGASFPDPWAAESLEAYLADSRALLLVADDPEPIGFVIARLEPSGRTGPALHIHDLAVAPPCRRRGAGTALLNEVIAIAREQGVPRVRLEVRVQNKTAQVFYARLGFKVVQRLPRYYEDGGEALRMELDLRQV